MATVDVVVDDFSVTAPTITAYEQLLIEYCSLHISESVIPERKILFLQSTLLFA